jgi:hypothetical protein
MINCHVCFNPAVNWNLSFVSLALSIWIVSDRIENTATNNSFIVACVIVVVEWCLPNRCLAMILFAVFLSLHHFRFQTSFHGIIIICFAWRVYDLYLKCWALLSQALPQFVMAPLAPRNMAGGERYHLDRGATCFGHNVMSCCGNTMLLMSSFWRPGRTKCCPMLAAIRSLIFFSYTCRGRGGPYCCERLRLPHF